MSVHPFIISFADIARDCIRGKTKYLLLPYRCKLRILIRNGNSEVDLNIMEEEIASKIARNIKDLN